jgi:phospholipid transport system transporter-binding protein
MLILPATITSREARDTHRMLAQALQQQAKGAGAPAGRGDVTVDASGLQRFDSSALAVLLECHRLAKAWGQGFVVRNAPPKLADLARLYGVDTLLTPPPATDTAPA